MKVPKNSKYRTHKKSIKLTKKPNDRTGDHLGFSSILLAAKYRKKIERGPFGEIEKFSEKKNGNIEQCHSAEKCKGGLPDFSTSIVAKHETIEGGPLGFFFEKSHNAEKTKRGSF